MKTNISSPVFRKIIVPWYDSETACLLVIIFMDMVFLFGAAGVSAAYEILEYHSYAWVPAALMLMSGSVIVSTTARLIRRYLYQLKYNEIRSRHPSPRPSAQKTIERR